MNFELSEDQQAIIDAVEKTASQFDETYWLERDRDGHFPEEFYRAMVDGGWIGIAIPEEYGGAGLGITEGMLMMMTVAQTSCGGMSAASSLHMNIFGPRSIVAFANEEQKRRWLPPIAGGEKKLCFGVTEPNAGLETTKITTRAVRRGDTYIVNGRKVWISTAQVAELIMLLARTADYDPARPTEGLTLFVTELDRSRIEVREIDKMGRKCVDSNELFIDDLEIAAADRIGEEGKGFRIILNSLNPERILIAAEAIGLSRAALERAATYAREREVFGRPIGKNQAIQHPLAVSWAELEAAYLTCLRAAALYDGGRSCAIEANTAKYLAAEAAMKACRTAVATHGGMGYAREYHVERMMREAMIPYLAPVSQQLALCFIAEKALSMPKSY